MKLIGALLMLMPLHAWSRSLCDENEATYFSCEANNEVISVCASKEHTQYRSGHTGKIDFKYPGPKAGPNEKLFYSEMGASRYHEKHLRFGNEDKVYVIFDRWNSDLTGSGTTTRGVSIFKKEAMPSSEEKAEFKREFLIEEKICKKSAGITIGTTWTNIENEDFIYGP